MEFLGARDFTLFAAFIFSNNSKCRRYTKEKKKNILRFKILAGIFFGQ